MATATVVEFRKPQLMRCSACGATANAACDCEAPYVRVAELASAAVVANPGLSDRAIARQIGVGHPTVARARRKLTGTTVPVGRRVGRDGKARNPPMAKPKKQDLVKQTNALHDEITKFVDQLDKRLTAFFETDGLTKPAKDALLRALWTSADQLNRLAQRLDGR